MKIPDGWVLVPKEPTVEMLAAVRGPLSADYAIEDAASEATYGGMLAAAPPLPQDPEIAAGLTAPGRPGAMYRLMDRCDWREVEPWMRGEIIRQTAQKHILQALAAMVSSAVIQAACKVTRAQVREFARQVMIRASAALEADVREVIAGKKAETILHNNIRIAVDNEGG